MDYINFYTHTHTQKRNTTIGLTSCWKHEKYEEEERKAIEP